MFPGHPALLLIPATVLLHALSAPLMGLDMHFDEAQYWDWSRRLDLGYYSKGPLVPWLIAASEAMFGHGAWQTRLPAWIGHGLLLWVLYRAGRDIGGADQAGWWAAFFGLCLPLWFLLGHLMTTDLWVILAWTGALWAIHRGLESDARAPWIWLGVCVGLGALAKLSIGLLAVFLLPALLLSTAGRQRLRTPWPWLAGATTLAIMSPMILWNAENGWVLLLHEQGHLSGGGSEGNPVELLFSQVLFYSPPLFLLLLSGLLRPRDASGPRAIWWITVLALGFFALKSIGGKVQPNWPAPVYAGLILLASAWLARQDHPRLRPRLWAAVGVLTGVGLLAGALHAQWFGVEADRHPMKKQHGWETSVAELAARQPDAGFLLGTHYEITAQLAYYWPTSITSYLTGKADRRMNQYDLWPGVEQEAGRDGLFVSYDARLPRIVRRAFDHCAPLAPVIARDGRDREIRRLHVWDCRGHRPIDWPKPQRY